MALDISPDSTPNFGTFVISLDFELYWGMIDQTDLTETYRDVLLRTREYVIPKTLELFDRYDVHATWASVGLLFFENKGTLTEGLPSIQTTYTDPSLSAYQHLPTVGADEQTDPFHYAPSLIKLIQSYPNQEIGSHSFSHYYCLEDGQSPEMFEWDMRAWNDIAQEYGVSAKSICFARNQYGDAYIDVCQELGIDTYRGNEEFWCYRPASYSDEKHNRKIVRWLDTYFPVTAHQCVSMAEIGQSYPYNIRSSRFLRAYYNKLRWLEPLKQRRIFSGMAHAAKAGKVYHLWWHPQDFGVDIEKNFRTLERILQHYAKLRDKYNMNSLNMAEIGSLIDSANGNA